jgi:hypothetical protein
MAGDMDVSRAPVCTFYLRIAATSFAVTAAMADFVIFGMVATYFAP